MKRNNVVKRSQSSLTGVISLILIFGLNIPAIAANDSNAVTTMTASSGVVNENHYA